MYILMNNVKLHNGSCTAKQRIVDLTSILVMCFETNFCLLLLILERLHPNIIIEVAEFFFLSIDKLYKCEVIRFHFSFLISSVFVLASLSLSLSPLLGSCLEQGHFQCSLQYDDCTARTVCDLNLINCTVLDWRLIIRSAL